MTSTADLLDLAVGGRTDTFAFELCDERRNALGDLAVTTGSRPVVRLETGRGTARTLSGLTITASDLDGLDLRRRRVRAMHVLENGDRRPIGVFMFGTDNRNPRSFGTTWTPELFDETFITDQPLDQSYGVPVGGSILQLFLFLVSKIGLPEVDVSGVSDALATTSLSYIVGSLATPALTAMAALLGCYPPHFNNAGVYRLKPAPPLDSPAEHVYESGGRIIEGSVKIVKSAYRAPNRWQVVSQATDGAIVGKYDLPDDAENSYAHTGIRVTNTQTVQGVPTVALANLAAYINALTDRNSYVQATWDSTVDSRHDAYDLAQLHGVRYQESGWTIDCVSGGVMSHTAIGYF